MDARLELLKVKNDDGVECAVYPYTSTKGVLNENGENLDTILQNINSGTGTDLSGYYNKNEVDELLKDKADTDMIPDLAEFAKKADIPSLDGYATESYVDTAIANAQLSGGEVDLSSYYQKTEVDNLLKNKADSSAIPDISGLATEAYVGEAIANAQLSGGDSEVDLSGYYQKTEVDNLLKDKANTSDIPDVSVYAKSSDVNQSLQSKVDIAQGTSNANKILQVNSQGNLTLADLPSLTKQEIIDTLGYTPVSSTDEKVFGTNDISSIGDGTITGAIAHLSELTANIGTVASTLDLINRTEV